MKSKSYYTADILDEQGERRIVRVKAKSPLGIYQEVMEEYGENCEIFGVRRYSGEEASYEENR